MKAQEFIDNLAKLPEPIEVEKYEETEDFGDELVNLVMNFDLGDIVLGDISFAEEALGDDESYEVGMFEEKFLVIDRETGKVQVEDDENGMIVFTAADNSEKFLDAAWEAVKFLAEIKDAALDQQGIEKCEGVSKRCAEIAGSEEYFAFYQDWLNCYEHEFERDV